MSLEKLLFLFPRQTGLSRDEFFDHYLTVHAPLGLEVTRTMVHYTVNLRDGVDDAPDGVDAFTETWMESIADFMNPAKSFASPVDAQRLMTDHDSFIGAPYDVYAVAEEVRSGEGPSATGDRSPGSRLIVALRNDGLVDRLHDLSDRDEVVRYVDNRVVNALASDAFGEFRAFVAVNLASDGDVVSAFREIVGDRGSVYRVSEYVQK